MRRLTLVMAYYLNAGMLRVQYDHLRGLPKDIRARICVTVIDDGSPRDPAWGEDIGIPLRVYRMQVDVPWNQDACRNIGAHHASTPWLLLTDMDHKAPVETLKHLVRGEFDEAVAYRFSRVSEPELKPYKPHVNSWFMTRKLYDDVGGYDERFAGVYGTDGDFASRVKTTSSSVEELPQVLIRVPREVVPDASTTTLKRKDDPNREAVHRRVKEERRFRPGWKPLRRSFPYQRIY